MTSSAPTAALPISVQAMWRTGSTYIWEKFRRQKQYRAYYEPLHELLLRCRTDVEAACGPNKGAELRHSPLSEFYFAEFPFTPGGGVEYFRKPLSHERYCLQETDEDEDLRLYIGNLIEHSARSSQRPVFQFNRALLRAGWLKHNFESTQILVLRNPRDVWKSFASFQGNPFETRICAILGQNRNRHFVRDLPAWIDIPQQICDTFEKECDCYDPFAAANKELLYAPFFDFYLLSIIHCAQYADCILNLDGITRDPAVRQAATDRLQELGIAICFDDCALPSHSTDATDKEWMAYERFSTEILKKRLPRGISLSWEKFKGFRPLLSDYFKNVLAGFTERGAARWQIPSTQNEECQQERQTLAIRLFQSGDYKGASNLLKLLADGESGELWNDWATAQNACSRPYLAELGFRRALRSEPAFCEAEGSLGVILLESGKAREALPLLESAELSAHGETRPLLSKYVDRARNSLGFSTSEGVLRKAERVHPGFTVFLTGLSGAGKSTIANALIGKLTERDAGPVILLDGDGVRRNLSSELGFSKEHRDINVRRIGFVAAQITRSGGIAICAAIAPYDAARKEARGLVEAEGSFCLVHVRTPLAVCEARDPKGLYAKAREGLLPQFTGVSDPYEEPRDAELCIDTVTLSADNAAEAICAHLLASKTIAKKTKAPTLQVSTD